MRQLGVSTFLLSSGHGRFYLDILLLVEDEIVLVARHERRSLLLQQMHSYLLIVILVSVYKAVKSLYGQLILLGLLDGKVVLLVGREVGNLCRGHRHQLVARVIWRLIVNLKVNQAVHRPSLGWSIFILFFFIFILCERKPLAGLDDAHETKVLNLLESWLGHL